MMKTHKLNTNVGNKGKYFKGGGGKGEVYLENRFVAFMNLMVARRMALLSWSLIDSSPYKYSFSSSDRLFKLFLIKIGITSVASNALLLA